MQINQNICIQKRDLRKQLKAIRNQLENSYKKNADKIIFDKVTHSNFISRDSDIFIYVSTEYEVNTIELIEYFIHHDHKVAVPYCTDECGHMSFFYVNALSELRVNHFGILEPDNNILQKAYCKTEDICIVPCLGFDSSCYRIGYGKGYYDRFLTVNNPLKIGLCYEACHVNSIPKDQYDIKLDHIITDQYNY